MAEARGPSVRSKMPLESASKVSLLTSRCQKGFEKMLSDSGISSDRANWTAEQQTRLGIWAERLGVFATGHASIEHLLRGNSRIYRDIQQLLDALSLNISYC
jgi:hypothetical protein